MAEPTNFQDLHFLSDEIADFADSISPRAARHIRLAFDLVGFIQSKIYTASVLKTDCHGRPVHQGPVVAALFMRGISLYEGAILLARRGMAYEAAVLCRALIDLLFKCMAIQKHHAGLATYAIEHDLHRLRAARALLRHPELCEGITTREELRIRVKKLRKSTRAAGHKRELPISVWAKRAGPDMEMTYRTVYSDLSGYVHAGAGKLDRMFIMQDGELESLASEPELSETVFTMATEYAILLCATFATEADLHIWKELEKFRDRLVELVDDAGKDHL